MRLARSKKRDLGSLVGSLVVGLVPGVVISISALAGCAGHGDDGDYPSRPGNGGTIGGGGGGSGDAGPDGGGDAPTAIGRVCLITDLRFPSNCAATGVAGLTVKRGTATMTTAADGRFTLPPVSNLGDRWLVTGTGLTLISSVVPFVAGAEVRLPIITRANYDAFRQANGITPLDGVGAMHVSSRRPNGTPKPNVTVLASPGGTSQPLYAGSSATVWTLAPGTSGVALVPNLSADGPVTITGSADVTTNLGNLPVVADSITFVGLDFLQ
jgi:hypothetical protein